MIPIDAPINILIVDDEPKNLVVLETILNDPSYRLVRATSADQALLALVVEEFALLILDIRMPGMSGFELAQVIKDRKKTARVPIVFLTAYYSEDQHMLEGYGTGAVDYLHKPVNPTVLRSKVAVFAELHRNSREVATANRALLAEVMERRRAEERLREVNDTLERRVAERTEALARLALHDPLTGLCNRAHFSDVLTRMLAAARRHRHQVAVAFVDLDRFKSINDSLGHEAGDILLQTVAQRMESVLRGEDCVARLGGDEFALALTQVHSLDDVVTIAEKVRAVVSQPIVLDSREFAVTTSIGVSLYPDDGEDIPTLLRRADRALYVAKAEGRDGVQFFRAELGKQAQARRQAISYCVSGP